MFYFNVRILINKKYDKFVFFETEIIFGFHFISIYRLGPIYYNLGIKSLLLCVIFFANTTINHT